MPTPVLISCCTVFYANVQSDMVKYFSASFICINGVDQGEVLSPILFTIYRDCLLHKLTLSGAGCHIRDIFSGALAYADDIVLLGHRRSSMMTLLNACEEFSDEYHIYFNAIKSKHIYFSKNNSCQPKPFELCGNIIPIVECDKHLGNTISQDYHTTCNQTF